MAPTEEDRIETIALFGVTGRTGKHFAKFALQEGFHVRALARSPDKIPQHLAQHERLEVVTGNLEDESAIEKVVQGASYVVCMVAVTGSPYPENAMLNFVTKVYNILRRHKNRPKVVLYQAGSMSSDGQGSLHPIAWTIKQTLGRKLGILPKVEDNNAVIRFLFENRNEMSFVVPRAGVLAEENQEDLGKGGQREVIASGFPPLPFQPVLFVDLAKYALRAIQDINYYNTTPFVRY